MSSSREALQIRGYAGGVPTISMWWEGRLEGAIAYAQAHLILGNASEAQILDDQGVELWRSKQSNAASTG